MNGIFREYLDKFVIIFLDDIIVYSKSEVKHDKHLKSILQVLIENLIYAKFSKCSFYKRKIQYLGHIISEEVIIVDMEKIKSIEGWIEPRNVSELRSFVGLSGCYRRFMEGFSRFSHPITSLQKKGVKFEWTLECKRIFQHL
jgi:hypothetical protein